MSKPISISHISMLADEGHKALLNSIHGEKTMARVEAHNSRVEFHWRHHGSHASPAKPESVSTMSEAAIPSRVQASRHGGSTLEVLA